MSCVSARANSCSKWMSQRLADAAVVGTDSGTLDPPPGQGGFASLITFNTGASGQIHLRGDFDPAAGTTAGDYLGVMCP